MTNIQTQPMKATVSPAAAYNKSRELLGLVYGQGFRQAKTACAFDLLLVDIANEFPDAIRAEGRIVGTDELVFWMDSGRIVAIWNPEMAVGVSGYTNHVRAAPVVTETH
ncbi:hypothetical protein [Paraburkholderia aromaticivorans]|uniref:hypothetical protein n=1 Tax=Paraburkholderia aromaticivorans TaxID=2026199 RepID=UPI001455F9D5|nr:hypothetical protein [Paraburkholderia aromaticivorans]